MPSGEQETGKGPVKRPIRLLVPEPKSFGEYLALSDDEKMELWRRTQVRGGENEKAVV